MPNLNSMQACQSSVVRRATLLHAPLRGEREREELCQERIAPSALVLQGFKARSRIHEVDFSNRNNSTISLFQPFVVHHQRICIRLSRSLCITSPASAACKFQSSCPQCPPLYLPASPQLRPAIAAIHSRRVLPAEREQALVTGE